VIGRVRSIALNTFREAVRDRVLLTLIVFAVLVMGASRAIQPLALGEESKVIKDMGLASITVFCVLIAILVGGRLVHKEVDKRTIYIMLSKPVRRWEFILGKYCGLLAVLAASLATMTACFYVVLFLLRAEPTAGLLLAVLLTFFELAIVTAVAMLFSTFATPITGSVFTFAVYFVGHMARDLRLLAAMSQSAVVKAVCFAVYYVLPNLSNFNIRGDVVYGALVDPGAYALSVLYALVYSTTVLLVSVALFSRREF
jgi:ABC-type transport system involved in multi-copper enzyme maturation permease subunit